MMTSMMMIVYKDNKKKCAMSGFTFVPCRVPIFISHSIECILISFYVQGHGQCFRLPVCKVQTFYAIFVENWYLIQQNKLMMTLYYKYIGKNGSTVIAFIYLF